MREPPTVSASITAAATAADIEPPTPEQIAGLQGAQVVLAPDSAASAGARGVYPSIAENTLLRDAGYVDMGLNPNDPSGELTDPEGSDVVPPADRPPVNTALPAVTQSGATLNCTMGEWTGEPTSYAYQWQISGVIVGTDAASYAVQPADVGGTASCIVTATNANGSTAASPSNGVVVA